MRKKHFKILIAIIVLTSVFAVFRWSVGATNISSNATDHWVWNDLSGWLDFYTSSTVTVTGPKLTGYASSAIGDISLDCATTRSGNICGTSNYAVTNNGGSLSGWGWNDTYGWINFDCNNNSNCTYPFEVSINGSTGDFSNYAWNDVVGWFSFNCSNTSSCGTLSYKLNTSWTAVATSGIVDSTTFDTGVAGGAQINSVLWHGNQPSGTTVNFQFAVSNASSGPWSYLGPDGTSNTWYTTDPSTSKAVDYVLHNNARYFRYRVKLISNTAQTASPRVDDINVNWSR